MDMSELMNINKICCIAIVMSGLVLCCTSVSASSKVSGSFTSTRACDAFQSFRKGTNPGAIRTIPGTT
jgi:ribonuclease T2